MHTGIDLFFKKFIILLAEKSKITADLPEVRKNEKRNAYNRYPGGAYHFMDNRDYRNEKNIAPAERRDRYRLFSFKIENRSDHNAMPRRSARFFIAKMQKAPQPGRCAKAAALQRVEKGANLEKLAVLHAEETSRNRAEFCISRGLLCVGTASERKAESANAA